jgi:nucleoside-diphosphate-sugar epimerase
MYPTGQDFFIQDKSEKSVFLTGMSGYVGDYVAKFLAHSGFSVVGTYRNHFPSLVDNVFPVCTDLASPELLAAPLRGVSAVVHLAWDHNFIDVSDADSACDSLLTNNLACLRNLLQAAEKAKVETFVFLSVRGASSQARTGFLFEKYCAECLVLNSRIPKKRILRSSLLIGGNPGQNQFLSAIQRIVNKLPGIYPVPVWKEPLFPLHISDLVMVLHRMLQSSSPEEAAVFHVKGQTACRVEEIFRLVSSQQGGAPRIPLPRWIGGWVLRVIEAHLARTYNRTPKINDFLQAEGGAPSEGLEIEEPFYPSKRKSLQECFA